MMSQRFLKFSVKFYCVTDQDASKFKDKVESFFNDCRVKDSKYEVKCEPVSKMSSKFIYKENVYALNVTLSHDDAKAQEVTLISEICRKWCIHCQDEFLYWLVPLNSKCFYYRNIIHDRLLKSSEFSFGTMPDMENFVKHYRYQEKSQKSEIMYSFYHSEKYFIIYFKPTHNSACRSYRYLYTFRITYDSISRVIVNAKAGLEPTEFYCVLNYAPEVKMDRESETTVTPDSCISEVAQCEYMYKSYERTLEFGCECKNFYCNVKSLGKSPVLKLLMLDNYRAHHIIYRMIQRCNRETEFYFSGIKSNTRVVSLTKFSYFPVPSYLLRKLNSVDIFNCHYAWRAVVNYSWVVHDQIAMIQESRHKRTVESIQKTMKKYALCNCAALCKALFSISEMVSKNVFFYFEKALNELFKFFCNCKEIDNLPNDMCLVRRIIITPSRTIYLPPSEHFNNRVIRKYGPEYMLRLSVLDDNYKHLSFMLQYNSKKIEIVEKVVKNVLYEGVKIGCRHYEVLASSSSQLRDHGMWMYAKDDLENSALSVREWMGDFNEITNIAKYVARMGQCFSSSEEAVQLSINDRNELYLNDIATNNGKYIFSDGIGTISPQLANEVRNALKKKLKESDVSVYKPCAFQIRYKGCKGMVVEDPNLDGRLIGIRPSMIKFKCTTSSSLEIVKVSAPRQVYLNRPLITIFEQLGISCIIFLKLQKEMILDVIDSLIYPTSAIKTLKHFLSLDISYSELQNAGFNFMEDSFFWPLLLTSYRTAIDNLKRKSKIAIPYKYGRNMFGVLDETRTLKYGQVFIQYSEDLGFNNSNLKVVKGTVVVTKNPCMHPGDVRKFEAIDVQSLKHIKDCIVFPSSGQRPHPDEMAGSDLDGDEFVVIWYPDLIFPKSNCPPMHYPVYKERATKKKFDVQDMINFFGEYVMNDNIGLFGNAHLTWADQHPEGIFSDVCLSISKKYPFVLDFAKTGKSQKLNTNEKPQIYPDFMEKKSSKSSYYSTNALGVLYRVTRDLQESVNKIKTLQVTPKYDPNFCYPGWEEYAKSAEAIKSSYNFHIECILEKFGINNEADAFSGYCEGSIYNQSSEEKYNTSLIVKAYVTDIWYKCRQKFFEESDSEFAHMEKPISSKERNTKLYRRASSWYMVVYKSDVSRVFSMPWTIADILAEVRKECLEIQNQHILKDECFLKDAERIIQTEFHPASQSLPSSTVYCSCFQISREILKLWIEKTVLDRKGCYEEWFKGFIRVFDEFFSSVDGHSYDECIVNTNCSYSLLEIVIDFLKFCSFTPITLENCNVKLQNASLKTLSDLAVTHDLGHLGIKCKEFCDNSRAVNDDANYWDLEGDRIRISVNKEEDQKFIENNLESIKKYLKKTSGVEEIYITTDQDIHCNCFLLISSIGKSWQRYALEDMVLDKNLLIKLKIVIEDAKK